MLRGFNMSERILARGLRNMATLLIGLCADCQWSTLHKLSCVGQIGHTWVSLNQRLRVTVRVL